jgi:nitrite reductase (NAD(P)H)
LLGLEAAKAVYDIPTIPSVSILIRQPYPLNRQLDASAGELVLRKIEAMGVEVLTYCQPSDITTTPHPTTGEDVFTGFTIDDGKHVESELVIFAIGIKPRDDLAGGDSGITIAKRGGIDVGDDLMSNVDGVYAIGECASWRGNVSHPSYPAQPACTDSSPARDLRVDRARRRDGRHPRLQPCASLP